MLLVHTRELDTRGGSGAAHREIKAKLSSSKPPLNQGIVYALNITPSFPVPIPGRVRKYLGLVPDHCCSPVVGLHPVHFNKSSRMMIPNNIVNRGLVTMNRA